MNMKNYRVGFTLIEVMVSLFLSAMVAFFVYTMMISSYNAYRRISSVSRNANSIRYFIETFSSSIKYCNSVPDFDATNKVLTFERYDENYKQVVKEKYYFSEGSSFIKSSTASVSVTTSTYHNEILGILKKDIYRMSDDHLLERLTISNIIRTIYIDWPTPSANDRFRKFNFGIIYDDVVDGKINKTTGKIEEKSDGMTEILNENTLNRRIFCFCFRGFDAN